MKICGITQTTQHADLSLPPLACEGLPIYLAEIEGADPMLAEGTGEGDTT